ncbi:MAG: family 20 glycosylhydrolase [Planctomycetota bacterium]
MTPIDRVYPEFREVHPLGVGGRIPRDVTRTPIDRVATEHAGGYSIRFDGRQLRATAGDDDGEASARSVLRQLAACEGEPCPAFESKDWPRFATRGFMLDISRNRVPTRETLFELVRVLSSLRMNHLQLYTEHTFAYEGHESIWRDASPTTPGDIRELESYCRGFGIELAANQNCFGHLSEWLRDPAYSHLAETHGLYDFYGITREGPFSLCPIDARCLDLVRDWIGQLRGCFATAQLNIGCDETADVGAGRSKRAIEHRGRSAVYAEFVSSIAAIAEDHGFSPMFWADIALESPEVLEQLPRGLKPLAWGYEPDSPFDAWAETLVAAERRGWVCPGTSCWRSFGGRTTERRATLDAAARSTDAFDGMLLTAWGDVGHQQQWPVTLHALADGAHAAWHGAANTDPARASRAVFGSPELGPWLDQLGDADGDLRSPSAKRHDADEEPKLRNASALFNEVYPANTSLPRRGTSAQWRDCLDRFVSLAGSRPCVDTILDDELRWTVRMSELACRIALCRRSGVADDAIPIDLARSRDDFSRLWTQRSRPGGLDRTIGLFNGLIESLTGDAS